MLTWHGGVGLGLGLGLEEVFVRVGVRVRGLLCSPGMGAMQGGMGDGGMLAWHGGRDQLACRIRGAHGGSEAGNG